VASSSSTTDGGEELTEDIFHVVCHDCCTEEIYSEEHQAKGKTQDHSRTSGHNVEYAYIGTFHCGTSD